ncbi:helix-turn-helix domain-containing protein [Metabacillus idriensis]|uniref:helix-turn-helix domain-containing protein n=1 Tax=Metabacillus idriensis TaxID=324768 RepID=UPI001748BA70|nr:AraC family transcriptional regulator [Metabacillus idriensis]
MHEVPKFLKEAKLHSIYSFSGTSWSPTNKNYTEILFVRQGHGQYIDGKSVLTLNPGNMFISYPSENTEIKFESNNEISAAIIVVKDFNIKYLYVNNSPEQWILSFKDNYNMIDNYLSEIKDEIDNPTFGSEEIVSFLLFTILTLILRKIYGYNNPTQKTIPEIVSDYIRDNFQKDLSLDDIASSVHLSPYYLIRIFKEKEGLSPIQYLIKIRLEEAKRLLTTNDQSIQEIANYVGYSNPNYFNIVFKKFTGYSPGKFRKKFKS